MIIERLALQNFMRYRKRCELDFSGKRTIGIVGLNECLRGDVPIFDPVDGTTVPVEERWRRGAPFHVYSLSSSGPVIAAACPPIRKPAENMLELTLADGARFAVTPGHRMLSAFCAPAEQSFLNASQLVSRRAPLASSSAHALAARARGGTRWSRTALGSQGGCRPVYRSVRTMSALAGASPQSMGSQDLLPYTNATKVDIIGAKEAGWEVYYDFHVPLYNNYWAKGVWHHNSGKSTILRAIAYALYGRVPTPQGEIRELQLINDGSTGDLIVECDLRLPDGTLVSIERGRTPKNEAILKCSGTRGKATSVQRHIDELLRLSYDDFLALTYFVQGDIHQFMAGNKRKYFQRWTAGLRQWKVWEDAADEEVTEASANVSRVNRELTSARATIEQEQEIRSEVTVARAAELKAKRDAESISTQVRELETQLAKKEAAESLAQTVEVMERNYRDSHSTMGRLSNSISAVQREVRQIGKGVCPVLEIDCDDLKEHGNERRRELNEQLSSLKPEHAQATELRERNRKELADLRAQLIEARAPASRIRADISEAKRSLNQANRDYRAAVARHARAMTSLDAVTAAHERVGELQEELVEHEAELRRWQFVRFMCGKSGIPAELIETELARVESRCNWVLERLDYPKRIRFAGFKELATFERICGVCGGEQWRSGCCRGCGAPRPRKRRDEPTVTVLEGTSERPFALESGGGQTLQSFSVRLSGGLFRAAMTGVPMRLVMLDEVFAHLDSDNRQKLMGLVVDKLATTFGIEQQFVVSHHEDVINVVDDMLVVRSKGGTAVAEWA